MGKDGVMFTVTAPPPGKFFEIQVTVRFGDTDPYGVVYFASYFRYCHKGIEDFLRHLGLAPQETFRNQQEGFGLPIAGATCDFLKPVWYGETLMLRMFVLEAKTKSLTFGFNFFRSEKDEMVAHGKATIVAIDSSWRARPLPGPLRTAITPFLPPVQGS
jgi:acyl-CoA thioester hydrolase